MPTITKRQRGLTASGLTPKQQRFVDCFVVSLSATQAALDAGLTKNPVTARPTGSHYLDVPAVSAEIRKRLAASTAKAQLTVERIDQEIAALAFSDVRQLYDDKGEMKPMAEWPDNMAAAVGSIEMLDRIGKTGRPRIHKLKVWDKTAALTLAARRLKLLTDKVEIDATVSLEDLIMESYKVSKSST